MQAPQPRTRPPKPAQAARAPVGRETTTVEVPAPVLRIHAGALGRFQRRRRHRCHDLQPQPPPRLPLRRLLLRPRLRWSNRPRCGRGRRGAGRPRAEVRSATRGPPAPGEQPVDRSGVRDPRPIRAPTLQPGPPFQGRAQTLRPLDLHRGQDPAAARAPLSPAERSVPRTRRSPSRRVRAPRRSGESPRRAVAQPLPPHLRPAPAACAQAGDPRAPPQPSTQPPCPRAQGGTRRTRRTKTTGRGIPAPLRAREPRRRGHSCGACDRSAGH